MKIAWLNRNLWGFSLASFFNDFCQEISTALLPALITQLIGPSWAPFMLGLIEGISDAISTGIKLLSGWLADRVHYYKPYLIAGYGIPPLCIALIGTAYSIWLILFYKTIAWLFRGLREPMRDTWLAKIVEPSYWGRAFGFNRAFDTLGALLGALSAFLLYEYSDSIRTIFFIAIIPGIFAVLSIMLLVQEKTKQKGMKNSVHWKEHLRQFSYDFRFFIAVRFIFSLGNFHYILLIYRVQEVFSEPTSLLSMAGVGWALLFYTFFNAIRAVAEFSMGWLSDYINKKNILALFGCGFFGVACIGFMVPTTIVWVWFVLFGIMGLSTGTIKTVEKAYAASLLPEPIRGTGLGLLQASNGIGYLISSSLIGFLWSIYSPQASLWIAVVLSCIAMLLLLFHKDQKRFLETYRHHA